MTVEYRFKADHVQRLLAAVFAAGLFLGFKPSVAYAGGEYLEDFMVNCSGRRVDGSGEKFSYPPATKCIAENLRLNCSDY